MDKRKAALVLGAMLLAVSSPLRAQQAASSTLSIGERYEIVQSPLAAKWTFRLDRFCGGVAQLVSGKDGAQIWEAMAVRGLPGCVGDARPHYQLFTSGIAARHTFLMNTASGQTWVLVSTDGGGAAWAPMG